MATWKERIIELMSSSPGLTDREITDRLAGPGSSQQIVNRKCRELEREGRLVRRRRQDGLIGNFPEGTMRAASTVDIMPDEVTVAPLAPHAIPVSPDADVKPDEVTIAPIAPATSVPVDPDARPDGVSDAPFTSEETTVSGEVGAPHASPDSPDRIVEEVDAPPSTTPHGKTGDLVKRMVERLRAIMRLITRR
jgi:hypothetical protein